MFTKKRSFSETSNADNNLTSKLSNYKPDNINQAQEQHLADSNNSEHNEFIKIEQTFSKLTLLIQENKYDEAITIIKSLPLQLFNAVIHLDNNWLFNTAVEDGELDFLNILVDNIIDKNELDSMVTPGVLYMAADKNHTEVIEFLIDIIADNPRKLEDLIHEDNYIFNQATIHGNTQLIESYLDLARDQAARDKLIYWQGGYVLVNTVCSGNVEAVKFIMDYTTATQKPITDRVRDYSFFNAVAKGYIDIVKYLLSLYPLETQKKLLHYSDDLPFVFTVKNGYFEMTQLLLNLTLDLEERHKMIHAQNDTAFIHAVKNGHLKIAQLLVDLTPDPIECNKMIHAQNDAAFVGAAGNQQMESLNFLLKLVSDKQDQDKMIHAGNDGAFKIVTARTMDSIYTKKGHNDYSQTIAVDYPEKRQKISPEIFNFFFERDFLYYSKLYNEQILDKLYVPASIKNCISAISAEIAKKYQALEERHEMKPMGEDSHDAS